MGQISRADLLLDVHKIPIYLHARDDFAFSYPFRVVRIPIGASNK